MSRSIFNAFYRKTHEAYELGLKDRRANIKHGKYSRVLVLPATIEKGVESTLAANRLILVDPRAEIPEEDLLDFLERFVEPQLWPWLKEKQASRGEG